MSTKASFLDLIDAVDNVPLNFDFSKELYALHLPYDTRPHGYLLPETISSIKWPKQFRINHDKRTAYVFDTSNGASTAATVNETFQSAIDNIVAASKGPSSPQLLSTINGIHSETFRIPGAKYLVKIERFTVPLFGVCSRGAHLTAYVRDKVTKQISGIWVAKRSAHLRTYPGMLDSPVAGGVKANDTPLQCVIDEAGEEASLDAQMVRERTVSTGAVTYVGRSQKTTCISPTVLYVFDLELPAGETRDGWMPKPHDGEVEAFHLWDVDKVIEAMKDGKFKANVNLVMLDFFVRHGIITDENEPDYVEILSRLHRQLPVPMNPSQKMGSSDM